MTVKKIHRKKIKPAAYNPRQITQDAKDRLRKSINKWGLVDPLIWNRKTGNLISGHQRLSIMDEKGLDYSVDVSEVDLTQKKEMALNIAMNNQKMAGEWDYPKLKDVIAEIDTGEFDIEGHLGFEKKELDVMFGISGLGAEPAIDVSKMDMVKIKIILVDTKDWIYNKNKIMNFLNDLGVKYEIEE